MKKKAVPEVGSKEEARSEVELFTRASAGRGEEELMPSFSGATSALVAGLEDLNERTSGTIGLGAGALSELAGRVPTRFLLLLKRDMWTGDAGARLTLEVHLAMRVGVRLQLVLEQDPERGGCDFDEVCRETASGSNIFLREWSKATISLDCNSWTPTAEFK